MRAVARFLGEVGCGRFWHLLAGDVAEAVLEVIDAAAGVALSHLRVCVRKRCGTCLAESLSTPTNRNVYRSSEVEFHR